MIHKVLYIGRWVVDFLFAKKRYDAEEVLDRLYSMKANRSVIERVSEIVEGNSLDTGFTYADPYLHKALIVIGPVSSSDEFINTVVHEIHHLAVAIADDLGIDLESETPAYISGDSARDLAEIICEMGCPHCKNKERIY